MSRLDRSDMVQSLYGKRAPLDSSKSLTVDCPLCVSVTTAGPEKTLTICTETSPQEILSTLQRRQRLADYHQKRTQALKQSCHLSLFKIANWAEAFLNAVSSLTLNYCVLYIYLFASRSLAARGQLNLASICMCKSLSLGVYTSLTRPVLLLWNTIAHANRKLS